MKKIISILILTFFFLFPLKVEGLEDIKLYLFYGDGCEHCKAEKAYLNEIKDDYPNLEVIKYEVWNNKDNALLFEKVGNKLNIDRVGVPTAIIGEDVFVGFNEAMELKLGRALKYYSNNKSDDVVSKIIDDNYLSKTDKTEFEKIEEESDDKNTFNLPLVGKINLKNINIMNASVIIGLINGFSPWILLFLISVLITIKDKKKKCLIGGIYLLSSLLLNLLFILLSININDWIRYVLCIFILFLGFVFIFSYLKGKDIKINGLLLISLVILFSVAVNLVELTSSSSLNIIFNELLVLNNVSIIMKLIYTLLYLLFLLLDELIVFIIMIIFSKHNRIFNMISGGLLLVIGLLLLVSPDWLMFKFK